jgi:uncharacterized protein (DUF1015 family)
MDLEDDTNMPVCNLAKIMHHAWSMQSDKKNVDIYDTTIDDLIQGLVQQSRYKGYFMGRSIRHGLDNNELCL